MVPNASPSAPPTKNRRWTLLHHLSRRASAAEAAPVAPRMVAKARISAADPRQLDIVDRFIVILPVSFRPYAVVAPAAFDGRQVKSSVHGPHAGLAIWRAPPRHCLR